MGDAFIIDAANLGIWIWLGRGSNDNERSMAMTTGIKFIEEKKLSKNTRITKVFMGGEPEEFKSLFMSWNWILLSWFNVYNFHFHFNVSAYALVAEKISN